MVLYYFTDVSKSESEPFHVVYVSCRHAEEAVEYFLEVFFLDPDAVVLDRYQQLAVLVPGAAHQRQRHFEAAILHGVVQQVEQYVRDVHLIHVDVRIFRLQVDVDRAVILLDLQGECIGNACQ